MQSIATTFAVLLLSGQAMAGHQPNPLPIFGADNRQYEVRFSSAGLEFEGRLYRPDGRNRYETIVQPAECQRGQVGLEVGVLQLRRRELRWTWTRYEGCEERGAAPSIWDVSRRHFSRDKASPAKQCVSATLEYKRKARVLQVTDTCDGSLAVEYERSRFVVGRHSLHARYAGRGRMSGKRWKLAIRPRSRGQFLRISGSIKELRGRWTRVTPGP